MSQTGFLFFALFVAYVIYATMRGDLAKWLDVLGI
jgi:hypothetical protein